MERENNNKLLIIIGGVILLFVIGFLIYYFLPSFTGTPPGDNGISGKSSGGLPQPKDTSGGSVPRTENDTIPSTPSAASPPTATPDTLLRLSDVPVLSPALTKKEDKILYYQKEGGDLLAWDFTKSQSEKISHITIVGMTEAIWSPVRDRAAVFYIDNETLKAFLHINSASVAVLPQNMTSFSWSPDGKFIGYGFEKDGKFNLATADAAGKNARIIFSNPLRDLRISWVTQDKIALQSPPSGLAEGFLFAYSRANGTLNKLFSSYGLLSLWSPDGTRILTSSANVQGKNLSLVVRDAVGKELYATGLATLPQKCVWVGSKEMYCAVPTSYPAEAVLPDSYLRGEFHTTDRLVRIDIEKKEIRTILNESNFDMENLLITKKKDYIIFVDRNNGTLWRLKLL